MQPLPAEPSFSALVCDGGQTETVTDGVIEALLAGVDLVVPALAILPRLTLVMLRRWKEKKVKIVVSICDRFQDLHQKAEQSRKTRELHPQWIVQYKILIAEFVTFAGSYKSSSRLIDRLTRKHTSEDDQRKLARIKDRLDDLFLYFLGIGLIEEVGQDDKQKTDQGSEDEDDNASNDSASTVASSP